MDKVDVAAIDALGRGAYRVVRAGRSSPAWATVADGRVWVFVDGRSYVVAPDGDGSAPLGPREEDALSAPMPATVAAVHVSPGQRVTAGDVLVTLEAMKMEFQLRAPRDATVGAIGCRVGDLVHPGPPLLELTP